MSENNNEKSNVHGLVLFKFKDEGEVEADEVLSLESIDQENMIKLVSELAPAGRNYRYSIMLVNQSKAPITEVKARLKFPAFLTLNRTPSSMLIDSPKLIEKGIQQINFEFEELDAESKRQMNFYFSPNLLNQKGKLATFVTFVNNKDFVRVLNSEPIKMKLDNISIMPKIIPGFQIQKFLQSPEVKKAIVSLGIGVDGEPNLAAYFNHIEQILRSHNFQLIAKDDSKQITWFFGTEIETKEDILVIGQIVINKVEFLTASRNHSVLIALLSNLAADYRKRILSTGIIAGDHQIYDLDCVSCGGVLPNFPNRGEAVVCRHCHTEQTIW